MNGKETLMQELRQISQNEYKLSDIKDLFYYVNRFDANI